MSLPAFDGSEYRQTVLTPLRTSAPSSVDDLFWLAHVPREVDDVAVIEARLKETKAFLHKERARPRQADVAAAVLKEWERIQGVLTDGGARRSLRMRLTAEAAAGGSLAAKAVQPKPTARVSGDPAARRRGQVSTALGELARLRDEPELAEDLFAFLGLPVTATVEMTRTRIDKIADLNRKRRADRERSLVDELLIHSRELLVEGDPASYRAGLAADADPGSGDLAMPATEAPAPAPAPEAPPAEGNQAPLGERSASSGPARIDMTRRPSRTPLPTVEPAAVEPAASTAASAAEPIAPPVAAVQAVRGADGRVHVTWDWPAGVTEAFVAVGPGATPQAPGPGSRKVTNMKYDLDGGAYLDGVPVDSPVSVHTGRRDRAGTLSWNPPEHGRETIAA